MAAVSNCHAISIRTTTFSAGEIFIASVYNAIFGNPDLWKSTALLIVYDEHGGIYDHVPPPACPDDGSSNPDQTGVPV